MDAIEAGRPVRVIVCGTIFGQIYLEAFRTSRYPFELAGILSQGSVRSRRCAEQHGVPLYSHPDQLPDDIDIACVVVRSGLLGGPGTQLAQAMMLRGIHVLQEHPLHYNELADCLRIARRQNVIYRLNPFYRHVDSVRRFVAAARALCRQQKPLFIEATCGFQVGYAMLDIIGMTLEGVRPWAFSTPSVDRTPGDGGIRFGTLEGTFKGVPITLRIQNQLDPSDPDNFAHLLHRLVLGTESGSLILVDTHGPIVWTSRPGFPHTVRDERAPLHFAPDAKAPAGPAVHESDNPSACIIAPACAGSYQEIFANVWPEGVVRALHQVRQAVLDRENPASAGQYHLSLCEMWQEITGRLGRPELVRCEAIRSMTRGDVTALMEAARYPETLI